MLKDFRQLKPGTILDNNGLRDYFLCSPQGGMRRSHKTNTLIIISNHVESVYEDRWIGDELHYTGMGQVGDQELKNQNRTLAESNSNGISVHLFEVFVDKEYIYQGPVTLVADPYQKIQPDANKQDRLVWIFPVKLSNSNSVISVETIERTNQKKKRKYKKKSIEQLKADAHTTAQTQVSYRNTKTKYFIRSVAIAELAKRFANGICQLCEQPAPFKDQHGEPYLETHHIEWLAHGGPDTVENTVALCPNCHKKMHVVNAEADREKLLASHMMIKLT
ncbi:TPA: HNH endonuclease [Acinetobacter baumannii]|uniref:HNH endonuclease n=1 Tax=Acinetobacter baumannii TaxID=470 RepID=UPI0004236963|nr:HNH endonuclease [Acinetobacter baumannii]RSP29927.1 HNH endonuclease [Acinetobacter baumannii]HBN5965404.1 HNH endonuclease [Acinetobacter baumannii]